MWEDIWIREFKGESTKRNPEINECAKCQNLDLRDKKGDLVVTPAIATKYAAPTVLDNWSANTYLGAETFHVTKTTTRQEVLCQVQKGTVSKVTGSSASVASKNILAFCIRPYWNGSAWVDAWKWLNRMYITNLTSKSSYVVTAYGITKTILDTEPHWIVYNVTKSTSALSSCANVLAVDSSNNITISRNDFTNGDTVIFLTNFIPFTYLEAMYSTTKDELCFHKVDGELRIGFGGYENRLGLSVKYLKKYGCVTALTAGAYTTAINNYDEIILDPYNTTSEGASYYGADLISGYNYANFILSEVASTAGQGWMAGLDCGAYVYWVMTAVLDDYQEFAVFSGSYYFFNTTEERVLKFSPSITKGTVNKRLTHIRLYIALSHKDDDTQRATEYYMVANIPCSLNTTGGTGWQIDAHGRLKLITAIEITKQNFEEAQGDAELNSFLNYKVAKAEAGELWITTDYVKSWDKAVTVGAKTLVLNPYITAREVNKVYRSIIKDNGSPMYDVIPADSYFSIDDKAGNDVLDMQLLPNHNLIVAKDNDIIAIDPVSGAGTILASGMGGVSRRGMTNFHTHFAVPSEYDVYMLSGNDYVNITEDSIRDAYRAISDKTKILGVRDEYGNSYRMFDGSATEYVFTPGIGWVRATISGSITSLIGYTINEDGEILMQDSTGIVYRRSNSSQGNVAFEYLSVPIDIALINKQLIQQMKRPIPSERFLIGGFLMDYVSPVSALTITFYFNGSAYASTITAPAGTTYLNVPIPGFPPACKTFQFKVTGTRTGGGSNDINISALGFKVEHIGFGRFG
jgi:hypothetical protein